VWIQYKLRDQKSEVKPIVQHNAVLPVEKTDEHAFSVLGSKTGTEDLYFGFRCYYGTDFSTAKFTQVDSSVRLKNKADAVLGFIDGILKGDRTETYTITIKLRIRVNKNGTIELEGTVQSPYTEPKPFSLKI